MTGFYEFFLFQIWKLFDINLQKAQNLKERVKTYEKESYHVNQLRYKAA